MGVNLFSRTSGSTFSLPGADGITQRIHEDKTLKMRFGYTYRLPIGGVWSTAGHHSFGLDIFFDRVQQIIDTKIIDRIKERVIVERDTVKLLETKYVQVAYEDTAKITALQKQLEDMGSRLQTMEDLNKALTYLEKALESYYQKKYQQALDYCELAKQLIPQMALPSVRKGSIYYAMGQWEDARREWERALRLDPENKEVMEFLKTLPKGK